MIIVGAKGLAKEILDILAQRDALNNLFFFDNVSKDLPLKFFDRFPILRTIESAKEVFYESKDYSFALGLGNPMLRYKLYQLFIQAEGKLASTISPKAHIGTFGNSIEEGVTILPGVVITSDVKIGMGCLINPNCTISHDSHIGRFVEMSPSVNITGNCTIGDFSNLGTGSIILPKVTIGRNVIVGAGAVVTRDVPDNTLVVGIPAVAKKKLDPLEF